MRGVRTHASVEQHARNEGGLRKERDCSKSTEASLNYKTELTASVFLTLINVPKEVIILYVLVT